MQKYVTQFIVYYSLITILVAIITTLLKMNSSLSLITVGVASCLVGASFTKNERRLPTPEEIKDYALSSMLAGWAVSLLLTIIVLSLFSTATERESIRAILTDKTILMLLPFICAFISVIYYIAIRWAFSWYAKQSIKDVH